MLEWAAAFLEIEAEGLWVPYHRGAWNQDEPQFLVFDEQHGIRIAAIDRTTWEWISDGGERLTRVTHWKYLPHPPRRGAIVEGPPNT